MFHEHGIAAPLSPQIFKSSVSAATLTNAPEQNMYQTHSFGQKGGAPPSQESYKYTRCFTAFDDLDEPTVFSKTSKTGSTQQMTQFLDAKYSSFPFDQFARRRELSGSKQQLTTTQSTAQMGLK